MELIKDLYHAFMVNDILKSGTKTLAYGHKDLLK